LIKVGIAERDFYLAFFKIKRWINVRNKIILKENATW